MKCEDLFLRKNEKEIGYFIEGEIIPGKVLKGCGAEWVKLNTRANVRYHTKDCEVYAHRF